MLGIAGAAGAGLLLELRVAMTLAGGVPSGVVDSTAEKHVGQNVNKNEDGGPSFDP